jgi:ubiquinone/menaquinone biosynthesis C-methylase UbiE
MCRSEPCHSLSGVPDMPKICKVNRSHEYELGHSDRELKRLNSQARLVDPMSRQFFLSAGLHAGMRVLDVGSGAGDVAFLLADLVGDSGEVVGTDRSPLAVAAASETASDRGLENVSFLVGDPSELAFERPFDAIIGRYILCFSPDPVAMLRKLRPHLRPGGIVAFHEAGGLGAQSYPPAPLYDRCHGWVREIFRKVGTNPHMCIDLYSTFVQAGLPAPTMALHTLVGGSESEGNGIDLIADLVTTLAPVMVEMGIATVEELDIDTLHARVRAEVKENHSILVGRYEIAAWSRTSPPI